MKKPLRCVLADDEPLALELLHALLITFEDIEIVGLCENGDEALTAIRELTPDLVFLDIEMPGLNGFDVISRLQPEIMPMVIFTTAYNQYAIDAFDVHAVDYVLKPLNAERLGLAFERARNRLDGERLLQAGNKASIMSVVEHMFHEGNDERGEPGYRSPGESASAMAKRLVIREAGRTHVIEPTDIDWVDAAGDYMCIHVGTETVVARITMKKLEEQLGERLFMRIHRSTLVNVSKLRKIKHLGKGDYTLTLDNGVTLKASRNFRENLMALLASAMS